MDLQQIIEWLIALSVILYLGIMAGRYTGYTFFGKELKDPLLDPLIRYLKKEKKCQKK